MIVRTHLEWLCLVAGLATALPAMADEPAAATVPQASTQSPPAQNISTAKPGALAGAASFQEIWDIPQGPQLVVIPAGEFTMGSPASEVDRGTFEYPQHRVVIAHPFAIGKYDITFEQWDACVADGGCGGYRPDDQGWGRGSLPVMNVSWFDAKAYVDWLSHKTGKTYRLPSEAEWEYAARAGTSTAFWWGGAASHDYANYGADQCCKGLAAGRDRWEGTSPVGSLPANAFGLFDMSGNVMQYVDDCWHPKYDGAPADGSAWNEDRCGMRILRGGAWNSVPGFMRSADRIWILANSRYNLMGFRVARSLP
jgi:formylglycine-generating enzyme required for sulfatase activity